LGPKTRDFFWYRNDRQNIAKTHARHACMLMTGNNGTSIKQLHIASEVIIYMTEIQTMIV
jgi:hypothetical protein